MLNKKYLAAKDVKLPLTVPAVAAKEYIKNYLSLTHKRGRLMLFAGDQRLEHLNDDFSGKGIHKDDQDPEHFFRIASEARIGAFATQLGLIGKYGRDYPEIPYVVKLNGKSNLLSTKFTDPRSGLLNSVEQVMQFKKQTGVSVLGVGFTLYLGSEFEADMLEQASSQIQKAHENGLIFILWVYPRGRDIANELDTGLIAGAAGAANCLGADFVKVNYPKVRFGNRAKALKIAVQAAGRTGLVCAGGKRRNDRLFLKDLHDQIHIAGACGNATGRTIHQRGLSSAIKMCEAISLITFDDAGVDRAMKVIKK